MFSAERRTLYAAVVERAAARRNFIPGQQQQYCAFDPPYNAKTRSTSCAVVSNRFFDQFRELRLDTRAST